MLKELGGCGRKQCRASTTIADTISFGTGNLDEFGFWEHGCDACARAYEKAHPGSEAWPPAQKVQDEKND